MSVTVNKTRNWRDLFKGEYNPATEYVISDIITYQGSSYTAIQNGSGNLPTDTAYWTLLAEKGEKGDTGEQGPVGDFINHYQGAWSAGSYNEGDIVTHNGSSYLATANTSAEPP